MGVAKSEFLKVENLTHLFDEKVVLENINFSVDSGEFLAILGPSGCGKTTILRILIGLEEPSEGKVFLDGNDITKFDPSARNMGIVFQNFALFENMTVLENVQYALKIKKETKADSKRIAMEMLQKMGLEEHMYKKTSELSGGQQQRVAIARTLVLYPKVILFDEPMSALDVDTRLSLRKEIKEIQKDYGITMIYITHDQEEAFAMADKIMVMDKAKVEQVGEPMEIIKKPASDYVQNFVISNLQIKMDSLRKYMEL